MASGGVVRTHDHPPITSNVEPLPNDFQETKAYKLALEKVKLFQIITIKGIRGAGKRYLYNGVLNAVKDDYNQISETSVVWSLKPMREKIHLEESFDNFVQQLKKQALLPQNYQNTESEISRKFCNLLKHLQSNQIHCILGFSYVGQEVVTDVRKILDCVLQLNNNQKNASTTKPEDPEVTTVKAIAILQEDLDLFSEQERQNNLTEEIWEVKPRFEDEEAIQYMCCHEKGSSQYNNEKEDLKKLVRFFGSVPVFLKAAYEYKSQENISVDDMLKKAQNDPVGFTGKCLDILKKIAHTERSRSSFAAIRAFMEGENLNSNLYNILQTLCLLHEEDIPDLIVNRIVAAEYQQEVSDESWKAFVASVAPFLPIQMSEHSKSVSIPKYIACYILQKLKCDAIMLGHHLFRAVKILSGLLSRDNREWWNDLHLANTQKHMDCLVLHAQRHFGVKFKINKQDSEDFQIWLGVCKLHALLGQAVVQQRVKPTESWKRAISVLIYGAEMIWDVVNSSGTARFLCFFPSNRDVDLLTYDKSKDVKEVAKVIAEKCIKAGKKVKMDFVQDYFRSLIEINKSKLEDFVTKYYHSKSITHEQAVNKFSPIEELVGKQKKAQVQDHHISLLRDTGNMLTVEDFQKVFLAECLCDYFHTYGRQDLYAWKDMKHTEDQLEKCSYYTSLSHHIAREIREKTGICLLFEFITVSNSMIPRSLQNRKQNEGKEENLQRLEEVYKLCKQILEDTTEYYENGLYMGTFLSKYTKLNAIKYQVKAANKMLKLKDKEFIPDDALLACDEMVDLAYEQVYLDMGPTCLASAAKFYASMGEFKKAFVTFEKAFSTKKGEKEYGINQHYERRPNTHAWAIYNFSKAVFSYAQSNDQGLDVQDLKKKAINRCKLVIESGSKQLEQEWKINVAGWKEKLEQLNPTL